MNNEQQERWISPERELPPEGVVVDCIRSDGIQGRYKRSGGLMFYPDGKMYIYVGIQLWRHRG